MEDVRIFTGSSLEKMKEEIQEGRTSIRSGVSLCQEGRPTTCHNMQRLQQHLTPDTDLQRVITAASFTSTFPTFYTFFLWPVLTLIMPTPPH